MTESVRRFVANALVALSLVILVYVGYAHLAALRSRRTPDMASSTSLLASEDALREDLTVQTAGVIEHHFGNGGLVVTAGASPDGPRASMRLVGDESRLNDVALRVRYRREGTARVFLGLLGPSDGAGRELRLTIAEDGRAVISGDASDSGERREIVCEAHGDRDALTDAGLPDSGEESEWHELALRVSPQLGAALGSIDGSPVVSCALGWNAGARTRLEVGVEKGGGGGPMAATLTRLSHETLPSDERPESFVDGFHGREIDPLRWAVRLPDGWLADARARVLPSGGLSIAASATRATSFVSGFVLETRRMLLGSFVLEARVRLRRLHAASFYVAVGSLEGALVVRRGFEGGLLDGADGRPVPFAGGHWTGNGQRSFEVLRPSVPARDLDARGDEASQIALAFDARTGVGRVILDGVTLFERPLDLRPLDSVTFRVGVNLSEAGAEADFVLDEVRLTQR